MNILQEKVLPLQVEEPTDVTNHKWKDRFKRLHLVKEMETSYIKNCINAFKNGRIPFGWHGGWLKWKKIFEDELLSRQ